MANPLWAKAPVVLFRFPGLLASLAVGALLLSLSAASYPLFMSSTASELVGAQMAKPLITRYGAGIVYTSTKVPFDQQAPVGRDVPLVELRGRVFAEQAAESPHLGPVVPSILGPVITVSPPRREQQTRFVRLFSGTRALAHVDVVAGTEGPGVWVPDLVADALNIKPGRRIVLRGQAGDPVPILVDGIYRALYAAPRSGYFRPWSDEIYRACGDCSPPPQFILAEHDQLRQLSRRLGYRSATFGWQAPVAAGRSLTLDEARHLQSFAADLGREMSTPGSSLFKVFDCCGVRWRGFRQPNNRTEFSTSVGEVIREVERRIVPVEGTVQLLLVAGLIVAAAVIAAAGAFSVAARKVESALLFSRGTSARTVAGKASLESLIPSALGSVAGVGLAFLLVRALGPGGRIDANALRTALLAAALLVPISVLLVGLVSALSFQRQSEHHASRFGALARVPWEVAVVALALYFLRRLLKGGAFEIDPVLDVQRPSAALVLFPILFMAGLGVAAARVFRGVLRQLRGRSGGFSPPIYLLVHRLAGAPRLSLLLVAASILCLGTFLHSRTIVRSLDATVDAKAKIFVGSDVQAVVSPESEAPGRFPLPVTKVTKVVEAGNFPASDVRFDLLGIDPATFASAAYWSDSFADLPLERLSELLRSRGGGPVPAIVVGEVPPGSRSVEFGDQRIPIDVVSTARSFPGALSGRPLVVVPAEDVRPLLETNPFLNSRVSSELWVKGPTQQAVDALSDLEVEPYLLLTAEQVKDIPWIAAVVHTFGVLNVLGLAAGLLVIAGMIMYLQARQRAQVVSYALSLRMGLSEAAHRGSLVLELVAILLFAFAVGAALALTAAVLVVPKLDPLAVIPPDPLLVVPLLVIPVVLAALLVVSWLGGWLADARARATDFAEVMRVAE